MPAYNKKSLFIDGVAFDKMLEEEYKTRGKWARISDPELKRLKEPYRPVGVAERAPIDLFKITPTEKRLGSETLPLLVLPRLPPATLPPQAPQGLSPALGRWSSALGLLA